MADGRYQSTSANLTVKRWSKFLHQKTQDQRFFTDQWVGAPLMDAGTVDEKPTGRPVFEKSDFKKGSGDRVRLPMEIPLTDDVAAGDVKLANTTGDNREEAQAYNYLDIFIDEYRKAVQVRSEMTSQRLEFDIFSRAQPLLNRWLAKQRDDAIFTAFRYGYNYQLLQSQGVTNNAQGGQFTLIDHPNKVWNNGTAASTFGDAGRLLATTGNAKFSQTYLDFLIVEAQTRNIPKVMHKGRGYWVLLVSPKQYQTLLEDTDLKSIWTEGSQGRTGFAGGSDKDSHPFLRSANLVYRDIIIMVSNKITSPVDVTGEYAGTGGGAITWTNVTYANSASSNKSIVFAGIGAGAGGTTLANADLHEAFFLGAEAIGVAFGKQKADMKRKKEDDYEFLFGVGVAEISGARRADFVDEETSAVVLNQSSFSVITYVGN